MSEPIVDKKEEKTPVDRPPPISSAATPPPVPAETRRRRSTDPLRAQLLHLTGILVSSALVTLGMVFQSKPGIVAAIVVAFATNAKQVVAGIFETLVNKARRKKT